MPPSAIAVNRRLLPPPNQPRANPVRLVQNDMHQQ
jgi:hypothetical protein